MANNDYSGITPGGGNQVEGSQISPGNPHTIENPVQNNPWAGDNFNVTNTNQRTGTNSSPDLGDLGRAYNFGNTYTNLSFQRDPFIHLLTKFKKKPTDDFKFEYAIKRDLATFKRYGYVLGVNNTDSHAAVAEKLDIAAGGATWNSAALAAVQDDTNLAAAAHDDDALPSAVNAGFSILVGGDYKVHGNITNKIGNTSGNAACAGPMTTPTWFLPNQVVRIPVKNAVGDANKPTDYALARITSVAKWKAVHSGADVAEGVVLRCKLVKATTDLVPCSMGGAHASPVIPDVNPGATSTTSLAAKLEPMRMYISGTAYHELSGYGSTWKQQPFSTDYGQTQIFKKTAMMSGRAMATKLKFGENPWANEWKDKMTEMTWEIGQAGYFGQQETDDDGITYTEGIVNFILNNGNSFSWSSAHTVDDYLEQLSALHDPRFMVGGKQSSVYYCNTEVWNWHAKLGGFMKNNAEISPNYNIQFSGTGKMAGVKYRSFDVDGTTIKLVRDIHLDQTNVKMICANMSACAIRPLIGNGVNRDVTVYPGVKTVKNSGEDYRVDLIQADLGFEFSAPETHAVWL